MGRLTYDTTIQHPSHPHPLHLTSSEVQHQSLTPLSCAACILPTGLSWTYSCKPCHFHLHIPCSQLPPLIHHPSHPHHSLPLLHRPPYPEGYFDCDACGRTGTGFSYHCPTCSVDLHTSCASMPLSVKHYAHVHPLTLAFFPPYDNKGFSCDVCGSMGGNHWLYRCALCEFDVHLGCAATTARAGAGAGPVGRSVSLGSVGPEGRMQQQAQGVTRMGSTGGMTRRVVDGFIDSAAHQIAQNLANGFMGGGGGGGGDGGGDGGGTGDSNGGGNGDGSSIMNMGVVFGEDSGDSTENYN